MKTIKLSSHSDIVKINVESAPGEVRLSVYDDTAPGACRLISGALNREQATKLAQAILNAAGVFPNFFDNGGE